VVGRSYDERGMLDFAFHPDYKRNGKFYILFSVLHEERERSRVSEFKVSRDDMNRADPASKRIIIDVEQIGPNHNGGTLLFREGLLYIFTGDGGLSGDPYNNAQDTKSLLGKALRINVDRPDPINGYNYSIPLDNPFMHTTDGTRREVYARGLRNPWRCSVDPGDPQTGDGRGRMLCGDVGQDHYEEVDLIEKGANYGWNGYEGQSCFKGYCEDAGHLETMPPGTHTLPIFQYDHSIGISVTGGYFYRGCENPNLKGWYIFGDWYEGALFSLQQNKKGKWEYQKICMGSQEICVNGGLTSEYDRYLNSFAVDELGEIYLLTTDDFAGEKKVGGSMYKLVDPSRTSGSCPTPDSSKVVFHPDTKLVTSSNSKCETGKCKSKNNKKSEQTRLQKVKTVMRKIKKLIESAETPRDRKMFLVKLYRKLKKAYYREFIKPRSKRPRHFGQ